MSVKIKGIYFTLANEQRHRNAVPLCFTGLVKGTGSSQALCPRASKGHVPGEPKGWQFQEGGREEPGTKRTSCHSEGMCAHCSRTLVIICFVFSHFLQGAQDQLPSPTRSAPECCFPCVLLGPMCLYCLQLRELVAVVQGGRSVFHRHHILPRNT